MKCLLSRGGSFVTPHGTVHADRDRVAVLSQAQREHLERAFNVTATPCEGAPACEPSEQERVGEAAAQANIQANVEAAQQHAVDAQRIPVPSNKPKRKR